VLNRIREDISEYGVHLHTGSTAPCRTILDNNQQDDITSVVSSQELDFCKQPDDNKKSSKNGILYIPQTRFDIGACIVDIVNLAICVILKSTTTYEAQDASCQYLKTTTIVRSTIHFIFLSAIVVLLRFAGKVLVGGGRMSKAQAISTFNAVILPTTALAVFYIIILIFHPDKPTIAADETLWIFCFTRWQVTNSLDTQCQWWSLVWGIPLLVGHLASLFVRWYMNRFCTKHTKSVDYIVEDTVPRGATFACENELSESSSSPVHAVLLKSERTVGFGLKSPLNELWILIYLALYSFAWVGIYKVLHWIMRAADIDYLATTAYVILIALSAVWQMILIVIESNIGGTKEMK